MNIENVPRHQGMGPYVPPTPLQNLQFSTEVLHIITRSCEPTKGTPALLRKPCTIAGDHLAGVEESNQEDDSCSWNRSH